MHPERTHLLNFLRVSVLLCVLLMTACASRGPAATTQNSLPTADPVAEALKQPDYRIGPHDLLAVTVFQVEDLNREVRVNNAGQITLPLIGAVSAAGKTAEELQSEIAKRYAGRYLQNPQVTLFVKEFSSQRVTVDGAVEKSGIYPIETAQLSLLQAVALGGGVTETGNENNVAVLRTINGETRVARFDLEAIREGRMQDPVILGNDIVLVDESRGAIWFKRFLQVAPVLASWALISTR